MEDQDIGRRMTTCGSAVKGNNECFWLSKILICYVVIKCEHASSRSKLSTLLMKVLQLTPLLLIPSRHPPKQRCNVKSATFTIDEQPTFSFKSNSVFSLRRCKWLGWFWYRRSFEKWCEWFRWFWDVGKWWCWWVGNCYSFALTYPFRALNGEGVLTSFRFGFALQ